MLPTEPNAAPRRLGSCLLLLLACGIGAVDAGEPPPAEELMRRAEASVSDSWGILVDIAAHGGDPDRSRRLSEGAAQRVSHGGIVHQFADGSQCLGTGRSQPLMSSSEEAGTIVFARGADEQMRIDPPLLVKHDAGYGVVHECASEPPAAPPVGSIPAAPPPLPPAYLSAPPGLTLVHDTIFEGDMIVEARRALSPPQPRASVRSQPPPQPTD